MRWSGRDDVAEKFELFARDYGREAPLYAALSAGISRDEALLALASLADESQPPVNLLFAAVHYMVLFEAADNDLARFYASATETPDDPQGAFPLFKQFCEIHLKRLEHLIATGVTNTNEVGRSSVLMPGVQLLCERLSEAPLHLIDIGCSAGLNLQWDRFHYNYGGGRRAGEQSSPVHLTCEMRGDAPLPAMAPFAKVASRQGIELNPADLDDAFTRHWLRALIWPEQEDRAARFEAAVALAREAKPVIHGGDVAEVLPRVLRSLPEGEPVCAYHSIMMYQLPDTVRAAVDLALGESAQSRPTYRLSYEMTGEGGCALDLIAYGESAGTERLALCHHHGAWLNWIAE